MASYTIELRKVCKIYGRQEVENWFKDYHLEYFLTPKQIEQIEKFNVWNKDRLATKIVDHYYMREIAYETPALFQHFAKVYMNEIMERQLPKIYSKFLEYEPLMNIDFTETFESKIKGDSKAEGNSKSNSSNNSSGLNVNSDTPQRQIDKNEILSGKYASNTNASETESKINDDTSTSSTGTTSSSEKYTKTTKGNNGAIVTNQRLIKEFREIVVAIDEEIILELNKLFFGLY